MSRRYQRYQFEEIAPGLPVTAEDYAQSFSFLSEVDN